MFETEWNQLCINRLCVNYEDYQRALEGLQKMLESNPDMTPKLFGEALPTPAKPKLAKTRGASRNQRHRDVKQKSAADEIETLKNDIDSLRTQIADAAKAQSSAGSQSSVERLGGSHVPFVVAFVREKGQSQHTKKGRRQRQVHWTQLDDVLVGKQAVKAVADPGAEVSVITLEAAQRLNQKVNTNRRPWLKPMWSGAEYRAYGRIKALVDIADGPRRWLDLVVVDDMQKWDLLLGNANLERLDVQLETPAMRRHRHEKAQTEQTTVSSLPAVTDNDYAEIAVVGDNSSG
ncbi:hypothetical protein H4R20_000705 [Coemansia guatemalensis]|uniref:Uncharacterized protein n=1 Tax=Coemansia guatemalensis TaxID=2761395 RepID=A0A9W8LWD1_9FUNG|nr:hypothetical protein H4R20_000705 [Coemansia guatemalensis]